MASNDTTLNAKVAIDDSDLRRLPGSFRPATAAARELESAVTRTGGAFTSMGARAKGALQAAGQIRGGLGQAAFAASSLVGTDTTAGATVSGALVGGSTGAVLGAGLGSVVPGVGTVIGGAVGAGVGAVAGGIQAYRGSTSAAEQAKKEATDKNTEALADVTRKLDQLTTIMVSSAEAADMATLRDAIASLEKSAAGLRAAGADPEGAARIVQAELNAEAVEAIARRVGEETRKGAADGARDGTRTVGADLDALKSGVRQRVNNGSPRGGVY